MLQRSLVGPAALTVLLALRALADPTGDSPSGGAAVTTTNPPTTTTAPARFPTCPEAGAPCGSCGPAGQCLEHVDPAPPRRVCVDGGFCVQVQCGADAQCPRGQVCAALGGLSACCVPCP
jgi:hypothetical protein